MKINSILVYYISLLTREGWKGESNVHDNCLLGYNACSSSLVGYSAIKDNHSLEQVDRRFRCAYCPHYRRGVVVYAALFTRHHNPENHKPPL
jgi:hypothetical protein